MLNLHSVGPIVAKNGCWRLMTVHYQCQSVLETLWHCQSVLETLWHWRQTVPTLVHQSDGAEMSLVRSVLGLKCLDTNSDIAK